MAYPAHHLFVMSGTLGAGADQEIWQCGIRGLWTPDAGDEESWLAYQGERLRTWFGDSQSHLRATSALTQIKINAIAPNGDYATPGDPHTRNLSPQPGYSNTQMPPFLSIVTSFRTAATGRTARVGRIYLPNCPTALNGTSRITDDDALNIAQAGETLIGVLSGTDDGDAPAFKPEIVSQSGARATIDRVSVGNVLDVQRRRKNKLREIYTTVPVII